MKTFVNTPNNGTLNMRAEPIATSKVLARIPNGTKLEVSTTTETWSEVTYNGIKGYVMNKFLGENTATTITKTDLKKIYDSLQQTLKTIESILK